MWGIEGRPAENDCWSCRAGCCSSQIQKCPHNTKSSGFGRATPTPSGAVPRHFSFQSRLVAWFLLVCMPAPHAIQAPDCQDESWRGLGGQLNDRSWLLGRRLHLFFLNFCSPEISALHVQVPLWTLPPRFLLSLLVTWQLQRCLLLSLCWSCLSRKTFPLNRSSQKSKRFRMMMWRCQRRLRLEARLWNHLQRQGGRMIPPRSWRLAMIRLLGQPAALLLLHWWKMRILRGLLHLRQRTAWTLRLLLKLLHLLSRCSPPRRIWGRNSWLSRRRTEKLQQPKKATGIWEGAGSSCESREEETARRSESCQGSSEEVEE